MITRRDWFLFAFIALVFAFGFTRGLIEGPGFTDAFYHLNAANRLVSGQGLTDPYLWTYIGQPGALPAPSHLYWLPLTSISAALGMSVFNAPGAYWAAQLPFTLMYWGLCLIGFGLGARLGKTGRHAWLAGLLTLFSGFFVRFWGSIDTFAPYALVGAGCLLALGLLVQPGQGGWRVAVLALVAGALAALGHLTRADGVLLLMVGWAAVLWPFGKQGMAWRLRLLSLALMTLAYLLVMSPWFARNLSLIGSPLPVGGAQGIWFRQYNDIFAYPPEASAATLFADGLGAFFESRWLAFSNNLGTFVVVEGLVVMAPLMLLALWRRRWEPFFRAFWIYALGLHLVMTFVFPFPGYRGGLLHSAAALVPWWAVLGLLGLDDAVEWLVKRRRHWRAGSARVIFSAGLLVVAVGLTLIISLPNRVPPISGPGEYAEVAQLVPVGERVMINDPAQFYYRTGLGGVVLPASPPEVIPAIARQYGVRYLLLEGVSEDGTIPGAAPQELWSLLTKTPAFLIPIPLSDPGKRLYEIRY
jgi:4-amino-4-deoxy-L-arabinose transferase-like glycosyltransferase